MNRIEANESWNFIEIFFLKKCLRNFLCPGSQLDIEIIKIISSSDEI